MAHQSPLISIPKKTTNDADYTNPIRSLIAHSYGEDPKNYAEECSVLQRCRQDAVKGAGSDQTARDLLYKYFGQLELLELRFAEIKVAFHWNDAFTEKGTTQSSLAFEKASIIHLLSSVLSSLAASQSRSDPEGLKRAYSNTRAAAGMLTYINDNFLHAPSTDLSREVVHFCIGIMTAQSTEIFTEKLVDEKKSPALIARSANSAAAAYAAAVEEMKDFQGKGVLDRNWLYVLQIKAKLFASVAQYYRALADGTSSKHGHSLVRLRVADAAAQDAQRQAGGFAYSFVASATPSLPSDAATSLVEITKAHAVIVKEAKDQASKDNDLIYHDVLPTEAALPAIEKLPSAQPITIQELYQSPEVSKLIGPDIFIKLVPLAVHESASVYSEEKAKLVRAEVERTESAEVEVRSALEHLGLPAVLGVWRGLVDDDVDGEDAEISTEIRRLAEDVQRTGVGLIENQVRGIDAERERRERELSDLIAQLDAESRECERMRAKHAPHFTQPPSAPQTAHYRNNITANLQSLSAAASSDANVAALWREIQPQLAILAGGMANLERIAKDAAAGKRQEMPKKPEDRGLSLLDLDDEEPAKVSAAGSGIASEEKEQIKKALQEARDKLDRLGRVRGERDEVLKDLKEKVSSEPLLHKCIYGILTMWIQNDDVSNLLLANRRQQAVEPQLFATELEKFRPYQSRIASAIAASNSILAELEMLVRQVERGKGYKERSRSSKDKTRRLADWERGLRDAGEGWEEVRSGLQKGRMYYDGLGDVVNDLQREVGGWKSRRERERENMVREIEVRGRLSSTASPPPLPGPPSAASGMGSGTRGLDSQFASMGLGHGPTSPPPRPVSTNYSHTPYPAPPSQASTPAFPPPPPTKPLSPVGAGSSNPYDFSSLSGLPSAFQSAPSPSAPGPSYPSSSGYPAAPPRPTQQPAYPAHLPPSQSSSSSYQSPYPSAPSPYGAPPVPSASAYPPPPPQQPPRQSSASSYPSQPPPAPQAPLSEGYGYQPPPSGYAAPQQQSQYQAYPPPGGHAAHAYHQQAPPPSQYPGHPPQPPAAPQGQQYGAYAQPPPQQHGGYYGGYGR